MVHLSTVYSTSFSKTKSFALMIRQPLICTLNSLYEYLKNLTLNPELIWLFQWSSQQKWDQWKIEVSLQLPQGFLDVEAWEEKPYIYPHERDLGGGLGLIYYVLKKHHHVQICEKYILTLRPTEFITNTQI